MRPVRPCASFRKGKHTPILALTGLQDTDSIHRAFEAGATDFIAKPINGELLGYRVRYQLRAGRVLEDLLRSEAKLRLLWTAVESLPIGITISDAGGKILYTNPAEAAIHGFEVKELLHQHSRLLAPQRLHQAWQQKKLEKYAVWRRESVNRRKNGEEFPVQLSSVAVHSPNGQFLGIVTVCEDITARKKNEAKVHQLAYYDALTGLPNRTLFLDRLQKALSLADRSQKRVAVLFLDLDNFKDINDTQGHDFGDRLLQQVGAAALGVHSRAPTPWSDSEGTSSWLCCPVPTVRRRSAATARRILEKFHTPFDVEGRQTYAGISIGIALYPDDATDLEGLLRSADTAMYQAKARGRQKFQFFSARDEQEIVEKVAMESALRQAMERKDLPLFYQPQWDLQAGRYCGVEVLPALAPSRTWGKFRRPGSFPLAESSGQIFPLGEWALRSACAQARPGVRREVRWEGVAVNVSGHQLRQPDFPISSSASWRRPVRSRALELEFTESVLMETL